MPLRKPPKAGKLRQEVKLISIPYCCPPHSLDGDLQVVGERSMREVSGYNMARTEILAHGLFKGLDPWALCYKRLSEHGCDSFDILI